MTECAKIRRLLALQRDDWSAEEARQVESHLSTCEQCRATADAYEEQDRLSRTMAPVTLTPNQRDIIVSRSGALTWDRRAPARRGIAPRMVATAAALAVLALIGFGLASLFSHQAQQQPGIGERTPSATGASSPLESTEWLLTSLNGQAPLDGTHILLSFEDGQVRGFAGCNGYGTGPYTATADGKLEIGLLEIQLMGCVEPEGVNDQEAAYMQALQSAASYQATGDRLELADAAGQTILVYARQPDFQGNPADLPGTSWRLVSLDGRSPVEGLEITLAFQLAGEATGHAGRRDYVCTYEAAGGDLSFYSTTMVGDISPDDPLLQQEEEYTTVLGWTRHYRLTPGQLELFTARGETLTYVALPSGSQGDVPTPAATVANPPAGSELGKLAWIQDGDIWIRVLPDSGPVRLTDDGGNSEPRWSMSGEWLAYRKDTQVWLVRASGQDAYAVDGRGVIDSFAWSPVAGDDRLAYVAGSGMLRLEVVRAGETQPLSLLPPSAEGQPGRIAWRPDGTSIAYEWRQGANYEGLWQVAVGGGEPVELYDSGARQQGGYQPGEAFLAGWTADGHYVLFWQGETTSNSILADGVSFYALPVVDSQASANGSQALPARGGQAVLLAGGGDGGQFGGGDVVLVHDDFWSGVPGESYVALTVGSGRETWTNKRIAVADAETGLSQSFTDGSVAAFSPVLSPDKAQIAYVAGPDAGFVGGGDEGRAAVFQRHIWVIGEDELSSANEPVLRQLTDDPAYRDERPLWSADGSHILFVRMDQGEQVSLWLLSAEDGEAQRVAGGLGPLPGPETGWMGYYGYIDWDALYDWWQAPVETAPAPTPERTPIPTTTPAAAVHPGVGALLQNPPAPGETVDLSAYFSGAGAISMPSGPPPPPDQVFCPTNLAWASALTDQPFLASLQLLNGTFGNSLPEGALWLVAASPEATQPGLKIFPLLPYLARFRGHLGDPAFAECPNADRIFIADEVVAVYQEDPPAADAWGPPAGYGGWPHLLGTEPEYSMPYPPGWDWAQIEDPDAIHAVALRDPDLPGYSLVIRVHPGETYYDQYDPASLPPLLQGNGFGVYEQGLAFGQLLAGSQGLSGYTVERGGGEEAVLFSGGGYTFELDMTFPTGFEASQALLTAYTAMVEGFQLASAPGPTPTPPIKDTLGPGPFLSEEEVLARARARDGQGVELWDAALLSEASARQIADACGTFTGHPDGVWLLTVRGTYEGATRTLNLFLDAVTGEQLCGEEIAVSGEGEGSTRLRVTNDSPYDLDRVVVVFPGERIAFGPLAARQTSDYRTVQGGVYAYAAYNIALDGQTIDQPVVDWMGEQPLEGESFTYVLSIDPERPFMQQIQGEVHEDGPGQASAGSICAQPGSGQHDTRLVVEEHPLVGPPSSPEETDDWFQTADGPTDEILAAHQIYRDSAALLLAEDNRLLEPFGYRLELAQCGDAFGASYRLYRDGRVDHSGIAAFSPVWVNASGTDFVMQLEMAYRPNTLTRDTLEPNGMRAAYVSDELVTVQVSETLAVRVGGQRVYDAPIGGNELAYLVPLQARQNSHALEGPWSYDGRWAVEWGEATPDNVFPSSGHVVVDGQDLNEACGYDESFNFTLLDGRPFHFFEQDGVVSLAYDGQVIAAGYDEIPHYRCCSGAVVNPGVSPNMVWFFATRGEQWYYVEAYVPVDETPESTLCAGP